MKEEKTVTSLTLRAALDLVHWPHTINPVLSEQLGVYELAILKWLHNVLEWKKKNPRVQSVKDTLKHGRYWVYMRMWQWEEIFPYIPPRTLRRALEILRVRGLVETGNFNRYRANRTLWYTLKYGARIKLGGPRICKRLQNGAWALEPNWAGLKRKDQTIWPQWPNAIGQSGQMEMATVAKSRHVDNYIKNQTCASPSATDPGSGSRSVPNTAKLEVTRKRIMKLKEKLSVKATTTTAIEFWKALLSMYEVTDHIALSKKETGMMKNLVSYCKEAGVDIADFLEFCVANWDMIRSKLTWPDNPKKSRITSTYPFFQEIYFLKEDMIRLWEKHGAEPEVKTISKNRITSVSDIPEGVSDDERRRLIDQIEIVGYAEVD